MKTLTGALTAAFVGLGALLAPTAHAETAPSSYQVDYTFTTPYQVTNLNVFNGDTDSGSISYGYGDAAANGTTTISSPEQSLALADERTFIFGVAQDLPGDPEGQKHLVLFTNSAFASKAEDIAFGTLFPHTDEDALIAYLQGTPADNSPTFDFAFGDGASGPNGDLSFHPGDGFTELTFSVGKIGGVGVSVAEPLGAPVSAAPELGSWVLMIAGVTLVGLVTRQRRRASTIGVQACVAA